MLGKLKEAERIKEEGNRHFKKQEYEAALSKFEAAIELCPKYKEAWLNKGLTLKKLGHLQKAIAAFHHATESDSSYHKAFFHLGATQYEIGLYDEAMKTIDHFLKSDSENQAAKLIKAKCYSKRQAKLFFAIVDLKFTPDGKVKILEFGRGLSSGTASHDSLYPETVLDKLLKSLKKYDLPIYLNGQLGLPGSDDSEFIEKLQKGEKWRKNSPFNYTKLKSYRGIYGGRDCSSTKEDILLLDDSLAAQLLVDDKQFMHEMILACEQQDGSPDYRPKCKIYPLDYNDTLADKIKRQMLASYYLLKKPNGSGGKGVVLVSKEQLGVKLKELLAKDDKEMAESIMTDMTKSLSASEKKRLKEGDMGAMLSLLKKSMSKVSDASSWSMKSSGTPNFLVESYEPSVPVFFEKEPFDGTMRVYFYISRDEGVLQFNPIACAWKLPKEPMTEPYTRESRISSYSLTHRLSQKVDPTIEKIVYQQLNVIFPKLFNFVFEYDINRYVDRFVRDSASKPEKQYGCYLLSLISSYYRDLGKTESALETIKKAKNLGLGLSKVYYEMALIYRNESQYQQSLTAFNKALSEESYIPQAVYERARLLVKLNRPEEARSEFNRSLMLTPNLENQIMYELVKLDHPGKGREPIFKSLPGSYRWKEAEPLLLTLFDNKVLKQNSKRTLGIIKDYLDQEGELEIEELEAPLPSKVLLFADAASVSQTKQVVADAPKPKSLSPEGPEAAESPQIGLGHALSAKPRKMEKIITPGVVKSKNMSKSRAEKLISELIELKIGLHLISKNYTGADSCFLEVNSSQQIDIDNVKTLLTKIDLLDVWSEVRSESSHSPGSSELSLSYSPKSPLLFKHPTAATLADVPKGLDLQSQAGDQSIVKSHSKQKSSKPKKTAGKKRLQKKRIMKR